MITLGLETSEPFGSVALYGGDALAVERSMDQPLQHAECLLPLIDRLLDESETEPDAIERVVVNRGPGSFTGLRIGLAAAKGLCQAWETALIGVDGTDVYRARVAERRACVVLASRRDLFYVRWFAGDRPKGPTSLVREAELLGQLAQEQRDVVLVGSGAERIYNALPSGTRAHLAPAEACRPSALWVARRGSEETLTDQLYEVEPLYIEPLLA
jgi:tRNA threonylcarbamoyladenosine biosynthesis protein TsaB